MAIKMIGMGTADRFETIGPNKKKKVTFPTLQIRKPVGNLDFGDEVTLLVKGTVSAIEKDEFGFSMSFKVKSLGIKNSKSLGIKLAEEVMEDDD